MKVKAKCPYCGRKIEGIISLHIDMIGVLKQIFLERVEFKLPKRKTRR